MAWSRAAHTTHCNNCIGSLLTHRRASDTCKRRARPPSQIKPNSNPGKSSASPPPSGPKSTLYYFLLPQSDWPSAGGVSGAIIFSFTRRASRSPDLCISIIISQPPTKLPLTNTWGMVGHELRGADGRNEMISRGGTGRIDLRKLFHLGPNVAILQHVHGGNVADAVEIQDLADGPAKAALIVAPMGRLDEPCQFDRRPVPWGFSGCPS